MPQSRQLAAIMFTDIVGYTALMGANEQKAFQLLNKNRQIQKPIIQEFGGKWIKELGDGVLASFLTVSDAVHAAISIQEKCNETKEFQLRIGIHQGEVVIEDNDIFGDAVNIASRIQAIAAPGGIYVSESVHYNIFNKQEIETRFVKQERLKNVREPVNIYEIICPSGATPQPLITIGDSRKTPDKTIAILPFADMSPTRDQEYLGDGLAEELLNILAQIKELKVIGRTSSFSFKGTKTDLKTIGKTLNADTILEGSIQKAGNRVRITAQLINAADGFHIWSHRYDREMNDIFALQDDICSKISEHLKLTLLGEHETREEKRPTNNAQAYELFLKVDFYFKRYGSENFEKAIAYCKEAIALDPEYADAWWYLGYANFEMHNWLYFQKDRIETVMTCIQKALTLNEASADAHFLLALVYFNYDSDWEKTLAEVALGNKYTKTPYPLTFLPIEAWVRATLYSDFDFALHHIQKGIENDPLNIIYQFHLAQLNVYCFRDYKKTVAILKEMIDLGFPEALTWRTFCLAYLFDGQYLQAEEYARKDYKACERKGHGVANLIISLAASGKKEEAEMLYQSVKETLAIPDFPEFLHVRVNAWLGRIDDAFDYLNKAIVGKSYWLFTLKVSPEWDPLRADPRFQKVLERMKFPE